MKNLIEKLRSTPPTVAHWSVCNAAANTIEENEKRLKKSTDLVKKLLAMLADRDITIQITSKYRKSQFNPSKTNHRRKPK